MSYSKLADALLRPSVAATTLGMASSAFFFFGNVATGAQGILPLMDNVEGFSTQQKLTSWKWMFDRAKIQMGASAIFSAGAYTVAAVLAPPTRGPLIGAAVASAAIGAYTAIVMMPTNNRLIKLQEGAVVAQTEEVEALLKKWKGMHTVRLMLGGIGYSLGLVALLLSL